MALGRRKAIEIGLAGIALLFARECSDAASGGKMTREEADYQDSPRDIRMCATCSLFEPPKSCKVVEGDVSPIGWCKVYVMAD